MCTLKTYYLSCIAFNTSLHLSAHRLRRPSAPRSSGRVGGLLSDGHWDGTGAEDTLWFRRPTPPQRGSDAADTGS